MKDRWIWICGWEKFQHYKTDSNPHWIKFYTGLMHDEGFLDLSSHRRSVLTGLWLTFASSQRQLKADPAKLSKRFHFRVTSSDLTSLNEAGFILIVSREDLEHFENLFRRTLGPVVARGEEIREEKKNPSAVTSLSDVEQHRTFKIPRLRGVG